MNTLIFYLVNVKDKTYKKLCYHMVGYRKNLRLRVLRIRCLVLSTRVS